ncbi:MULTISPECIES: ABC transporter substrate-binding protein [unclassified Rhodococcus (in: high G+C Gram-positive bacteria)]|uniref:ABC transporter substrate-binding protein n=1 Tax=unclassified Rhodococcus (in: high G+C Gram-positive bacteria) TaxID=192944 RepID=UPI00163A9571|nr:MULTISPECIES: ABC transporter substrate-binding protein [unclassified Rhodococcus (in: high G+C Gram-positive bacteria)]MBC2639827.1 ABC transporter substrate-binding protein [Rhodococcus sp. 3A]MBC2895427.1 ABC transporter substrate-binding protein [Rhodococcus sp. 4CII]
MRIRSSALTAALAVTALAVTGCAGSGASEADAAGGPYRVFVTGGISAQGSLAANAQTSVLAAKASAEAVNRAGGVGGRQVEITVVDDAGDATNAVSKLREAIASGKKPDLFLNSGPSTITTATLPILAQNKILSFNIGPTEDSANPEKYPLNFDLASGPAENAETIARYIKGKGYQSVGVVHSSSAYGEVFGQAMEDALSGAGVTGTGSEEYDSAALDMTAQLQSLKNRGTQALVVDAYGAPLGYLLTSLQRLDWNIPLIGNTSVAGTSLVSKPAPDGVLGTPATANLVMHVMSSTVYDARDTAVNTMVDNMKAMGDIPSTLILADNYDALPLVAAAANKSDSSDPEALAEALENQDVLDSAETAFSPSYHFTAESHASKPGDEAYKFVPPSPLLNGQYGNPSA